jgi:SAM-dependent methyltransferase
MNISGIASRLPPGVVRSGLRWIWHLGRLPETRCVRFQGHALPPRGLRPCGVDFANDAYYVRSALEEAKRLKDALGLGPASRLLDVGCGPGRIPIGLLGASIPLGRYDGVDVDKRAIRWCKKFISGSHPEYHFWHVDAKNERYNPHGRELTPAFSLPFDSGVFDIIYLWGIFVHLIENDVRIYTRELRRVLSPGGKVFLNASVEEGVPPMTVNPGNFPIDCRGPLHYVRYEKGHLFSIFESCGFEVERFVYGTDPAPQSGIYLRAAGQAQQRRARHTALLEPRRMARAPGLR